MKIIATITIICLFSLFYTFPAKSAPVKALICPICEDFKNVGENIYISKYASNAETESIKSMIANGISRVSEFYPGFHNKAKIFVCTSQICDRKLELASPDAPKAQTYGASFITISSRGVFQEIFTHEIAHEALHDTLINAKLLPEAFPVWFDEGLAVYISSDERYIYKNKKGILACKNSNIDNLPITHTEWEKETKKSKEIYSRAGCRAAIWVEKVEYKTSVYEKIKSMAQEGNFTE